MTNKGDKIPLSFTNDFFFVASIQCSILSWCFVHLIRSTFFASLCFVLFHFIMFSFLF